MRLFDIGTRETPAEVTNRVWTVPNALSFARLAILPVVYFDLALEPLNHPRAFVLVFVFAATDWFDGYVARRFDQVSRLGQLLDPISDRLLIATVGIGMVVGGVLPLWVVVAILARDAIVAIGGLSLAAMGRRPPAVTRIGKAATFDLMFAVGFFLLASVLGSPEDPERITHVLGWVFFGFGIVLYYVALGQYVWFVLRDERPSAEGAPSRADGGDALR